MIINIEKYTEAATRGALEKRRSAKCTKCCQVNPQSKSLKKHT